MVKKEKMIVHQSVKNRPQRKGGEEQNSNLFITQNDEVDEDELYDDDPDEGTFHMVFNLTKFEEEYLNKSFM